MKILIGLFCLSLIWIAYEMVYAPLVDDDENIIDIDPDNEYDNLF